MSVDLWNAPRSIVRMRASMNPLDAAHQIIALEAEVVALRGRLVTEMTLTRTRTEMIEDFGPDYEHYLP